MRRAITTGAAVAKRILPEKGVEWLRRIREKIFGPASVYMIRDDLENLPPAELPDGYHVTPVTPDTEADFLKVVRSSLLDTADPAWFSRTFQEDPEYDPRNLLIIRKGDVPVGVAAAWQATWEGQKIGLIHNVGVDADFLRQGLGRAVTILALHRLSDRGFERALLTTEDHRISAINLYRSLAFKPLIFNRFHERRWEKILLNIRASVAADHREIVGTE